MSRIIISLIFIATAVAIFFVWTNHYLEDINGLNEKKNEYDYILGRDREIKSIRDEKVANFKSISKENLDKLNKLLPSKVENIRLIIDMTDIINRRGLSIKSIDAKGSSGASSNDINTASLDFSVESSYETFLLFLEDMEKSLRLMDIKSLNLTSTDKMNLYNFNVKAVTFWK